MRHNRKIFGRLGTVGVLAAMLGMAGCQSSGDRTMTQKWGDREVAGGVKKELSKDPYKYSDVQAVVYDGTVQLTGFVDTPQQRERAAQLAAHAKGARQIINSISLKPTPRGRTQADTNTPAPPPQS